MFGCFVSIDEDDIFGFWDIILFLGDKKEEFEEVGGIVLVFGVNNYLWWVILDILLFMLLLLVDLVGGVVIIDWYVDFLNLEECFKVIVYILD